MTIQKRWRYGIYAVLAMIPLGYTADLWWHTHTIETTPLRPTGMVIDIHTGRPMMQFLRRRVPKHDIVIVDGRRMLWGGDDPSQHFDAENLRVQPGQLWYGLGREHFEALISPAFESVDQAQWLKDDDKILVLKIKDQVRVYPQSLLRNHEVVNDTVHGQPVFAAYCMLADLGAVYDRRYGEHTLTFGVSGYTYQDPHVWNNAHAFVLWDRDTESLWAPSMGKAISGPMVDQPMKLLDKKLWSQTTWREIKIMYPQAKILSRDQDHQIPKDWPKIKVQPVATTQPAQESDMSHKWGGNTTLKTAG